MNETLFIAEITKLKKEKLECNECLEDLRRKFVANDAKIKEYEAKKNELAYKLGCLQQIKDELTTQSDRVLKCESGINLLKQLTVLRKQEKETTAKMFELKATFCEMKEKGKFYAMQANEVRKIMKHMKLASQKLWERIDRLCEQYEQCESRDAIEINERSDYPNKRLKINGNEKFFEVVKDEKKDEEKSCVKIAMNSSTKETNEPFWKLKSPDKNAMRDIFDVKTSEKQEKGNATDELNVYIENQDQCSNKDSKSGENRAQKWDVSRRDITLVKIIKQHLYVGSSDGTIKRFNIEMDSEVVSYDTKKLKAEGLLNSRVKSLFARDDKTQLFVSLDDGFLCCFNLNSGELISDFRMESYIVSCVEGWGELIAGLSNRKVAFLRFTPNFTHLRTLNLKALFQAILAIQPLVSEEEHVKQLLVLGKGNKPIVVDALTGDVLMTFSNQAIYSPAFVVLNGDILCIVFTRSPEALRHKDSFISFFDKKKNYEEIKMEFTKGVVTAAKVYGDFIIIALLRYNFTRILCYNFNGWKHLWTTFIGYEKVFALDFIESGIYFGCRNGCVHRIQVDTNAISVCDDNRCNCGQPFALISDLRNIQFH